MWAWVCESLHEWASEWVFYLNNNIKLTSVNSAAKLYFCTAHCGIHLHTYIFKWIIESEISISSTDTAVHLRLRFRFLLFSLPKLPLLPYFALLHLTSSSTLPSQLYLARQIELIASHISSCASYFSRRERYLIATAKTTSEICSVNSRDSFLSIPFAFCLLPFPFSFYHLPFSFCLLPFSLLIWVLLIHLLPLWSFAVCHLHPPTWQSILVIVDFVNFAYKARHQTAASINCVFSQATIATATAIVRKGTYAQL